MEFIIRKAVETDVKSIMEIMEEAANNEESANWFLPDDEPYVRDHLEEKGFILVAEAAEGEIAGFFMIKIPEAEENLGQHLSLKAEELEKVAVMDSAAVRKKYRGNRLQGKMLEAAEEMLEKQKYPYLLCTVHPENCYSLNNMKNRGYQIMKTTECYGGLIRHILLKQRH